MFISSAQMYQEMRSLHDAVTRVDSKLEALTGQTAQLSDHENRIRLLERGRWPLPTIAVLAGVAGAATGLIALFQH
ncbi:hypothetical protein [Streptomyces cucumeris]|uniref:hypothetical protein n=1 Tax=Streptomyces cucumeris TaxID=2962890 RepID=UPI0020C88153|nr:hypothetical protein [Streptomyces sp. NEAU-Y11]MCP9209273.1 hypothetical protein [Streptomyces sp. NEAU-Y11]